MTLQQLLDNPTPQRRHRRIDAAARWLNFLPGFKNHLHIEAVGITCATLLGVSCAFLEQQSFIPYLYLGGSGMVVICLTLALSLFQHTHTKRVSEINPHVRAKIIERLCVLHNKGTLEDRNTAKRIAHMLTSNAHDIHSDWWDSVNMALDARIDDFADVAVVYNDDDLQKIMTEQKVRRICL